VPAHASPNVSLKAFLAGPVTGCEEAVSDPCFEGCVLPTKCESRDQRAQRQWRRRRLLRESLSRGIQTLKKPARGFFRCIAFRARIVLLLGGLNLQPR
jgi:hypothetical protein